MKKLLLMFVAGSIAFASNAQERMMFNPLIPQGEAISYKSVKSLLSAKAVGTYAQKTTAADRWYSFPDYFDTSQVDAGPTASLYTSYMWKDTMGVMAYSGTSGLEWHHNRNVSVGMVIDPSFSGFNNTGYYLGQMKIMPENGYSVDSIAILGIYGYKPTNTYVDTLRLAFVYGDASRGNGTTGPDVYLARTGNTSVWASYGMTDSMDTYRMHFDTVNTRTTGSTMVIRDIILNNTTSTPAFYDTLSNGWYYGKVGFPAVNVPAGNMIGASLTFISGSPSFTPHDTVFGSSIGYKHNMFRAASIYSGTISSSGPSAAFAPYSAANRNSGMYKTLPDTANKWGGQYIPLWFWSASGGGASTNQYPYMEFHIKCPTCGVVTIGVNDVQKIVEAGAYPNPVVGELNIPFTLSGPADVTVSLTNVMGQVVSSKNFGKVDKGRAVFNTTLLPPGLYVYTVVYDGQRHTGAVTITN